MIADLKEKAAGLDKKRVYTAIAALVIAGAAGHFMQRTASAPEENTRVIASVPGTASVPAPQPAPAAPAEQIAANESPEAVDAPADVAEAIAPSVSGESTLATVDTAGAGMEPTTADAEPEAVADATTGEGEETLPETELATTTEAPASPADDMSPDADVTRAAAGPLLGMPETTPAPELADDDSSDISLAATDDMNDLATEPTAPVANCDIALDAVAQDAAMVAISLSAPCNPGEDVAFDHAGLTFSEQLGPDGDLFLLAPAMAENAVFVATFADGQEKAVEVHVGDFADYERVAVVWKGATGLQLNALENGANYGEPGHIWAEHPATPDVASAGEGGFVSVLGSTADGYAADVYTYPAGLMDAGATPQVSVEAQVMENTCDGTIEGRILRSNAAGVPTSQPLSMVVPGCDAVGEYLVLKNLPQDLKLARN